jgi:hypothetical protein
MIDRESPRRSLLLILVPMLLTFSIQRVILHHSPPSTHVYVSGYLVHHLFSGVLLLIPTAFLLAFGIRSDRGRALLTMLLGVSSSMVLDEVIFLICTDGSGEAYRGRVSFWGALTLMALASGVLLTIFALSSRNRGPAERLSSQSSVR